MASILKITDGTTTVDFVADSAYRVLEWSPAVTSRREGALAGRGPYNEVIDEMTIYIGGANPQAKLQLLSQLIDQAERWSRRESSTPVQIHYKLTSSSSELTALILGPPTPGGEAIILPPRFGDSPTLGAIDPVVLRFRRAGLWLAPALGDSSSNSSLTETGYVTTTEFASTVGTDSPYTLVLSTIPWNEAAVWDSLILIASDVSVAEATKRLFIIDAEDLWNVGGPTQVTETTSKRARGNKILRFDFSGGGTWKTSTPKDVTTISRSSTRRWAVFASVRSNSTSKSYTVTFEVLSTGRNASTAGTLIPAGFNDNKPKWVHMGFIEVSQPMTQISMVVVASASGGADNQLDCDSIALLAADDLPDSAVVEIRSPDTYPAGTNLGSSMNLVLEHAIDWFVEPRVHIAGGSAFLPQSYSGDPALILPGGRKALAVAWLSTGKWDTTTWRSTDSSGVVIRTVFAGVRMKGYLTVQ